jgi:hypothetical protein
MIAPSLHYSLYIDGIDTHLDFSTTRMWLTCDLCTSVLHCDVILLTTYLLDTSTTSPTTLHVCTVLKNWTDYRVLTLQRIDLFFLIFQCISDIVIPLLVISRSCYHLVLLCPYIRMLVYLEYSYRRTDLHTVLVVSIESQHVVLLHCMFKSYFVSEYTFDCIHLMLC